MKKQNYPTVEIKSGPEEARELIAKRVASVIDERILPEAMDTIAEWTGELMGEMTTLGGNEEETRESHEIIFNGLVAELRKQLFDRQK